MAAKKAKAKAKAKAPKKETTKKPGTAVVAIEKEAPDPKVVAKLEPIAKEINVRFEKAAKLDGQADDHRLAAAIQLAKAKELCDGANMKFKEWAAENVQQKYETVRQLVRIGSAPEPAKALADLREGNRRANKQLRERQQGDGAMAGAITHQPESEDIGELPEIPNTIEGVGALKAAFDLLKATEKMEFMQYCAEQTGVSLSTGFDNTVTLHPFARAAAEVAGEEIPEIPENLRRRKRA